jgi:hypothetical protein
MSCLISAIASRRLVLLCARLLVQSVMALSLPQIGSEAPVCFGAQHASSLSLEALTPQKSTTA